MRLEIPLFNGIAPKINKRLLKNSQAQRSENCRFTAGSLQSWGEPVKSDTPAHTGTLESIYLYRGLSPSKWLAWNTDVDVVEGAIADNTTERIYWTGDGKPKTANNENSAIYGVDGPGGTSEYPENSVSLGVPAPTAKPTVAINVAGTAPEDRVYVYTFVDVWGQEGKPSPASDIVSVDGTDGVVDLSAMEITYAADYNTLDKIRIYRSLSGTVTAKLQFVAEIAVAATYTDSIVDTSLGEILPTEDCDLPPDDMFGLIELENGIFAGFTKYEILFCEPYLPYAWPIKYRLAITDEIVGGGYFGNTLVVCTTDNPRLVIGNHPATMSMSTYADTQACVSKRGIVSMKGGVIYPSPNGLYFIGYGGGRLLTENHYERDSWNDVVPSLWRAKFWDNKYIAFNETEGFAFDLTEKAQIISITKFNFPVDGLFTDSDTGLLYISKQVNGANEIHLFNGSGQRMPYIWKSKRYPVGRLAAITAGRVIFAGDNLLTQEELDALNASIAAITAANQILLANSLDGEVNTHMVNELMVNGDNLAEVPAAPGSLNLVIRLYGDGVLVDEKTISDQEPFRFKSTKKYREYEVELESLAEIENIRVASSVRELRA